MRAARKRLGRRVAAILLFRLHSGSDPLGQMVWFSQVSKNNNTTNTTNNNSSNTTTTTVANIMKYNTNTIMKRDDAEGECRG